MRAAADPSPERLRIRFHGVVQGVGFRPFLHGLAARHGVSGFVLNDADGVLAEVEGAALAAFLAELRRRPPPLARIDGMDIARVPPRREPGFAIRDSAGAAGGRARIGPDAAPCAACLGDLFDSAGRFHLYPFVTCTDCGPRFTITERLPFDRANTVMAGFPRCAACARDYADPASRRFHAETSACPACGPRLSHPVAEIAAALRGGRVVALKGIGGFHLLCDAADEAAVRALRARKARPDKPFAVMAADLAATARLARPDAGEAALLQDAARPIVLVRAGAGLAPSVAPGLDRVGLMLPSAPVHHLLFHAGAPPALVATSANPPGEPLLIEDAEARRVLAGIADLTVTHDRPILARADDSVMAVIGGAPAFIRRARGFVPDPIDLGEDGPPVLAVGAHLKATVCVTRGREAFVSQHIGDLGTAGALRAHREAAHRLLAMLGVAPRLVACDLHPDHGSTRFAESTGWRLLRVQHHAAHLAAVAAEHLLSGDLLGVALDGHGHGADGASWGGELMRRAGARWRRLGHLAPLPLPGGDRAAREPWRMAVAVLATLGHDAQAAARFPAIPQAGPLAASTGWPTTTSLGRLFDAAAALLGVRARQGYEGQAAMELEALVRAPACLPGGYRIAGGVLDFAPLLDALLAPGLPPREGAELFHGTLIAGIAAWVGQRAGPAGPRHVVLGGGCLMNRVLAEGLVRALRAEGLVPWLARAVPCNDGGLSLGQAAIARARLMSPRAARPAAGGQ